MPGRSPGDHSGAARVRLSVERLLQDLRYAGRVLRRSPAFTCVAILSLGIGIGANTAIFGVVDALILKKLPVPDPDRLVLIDSDTRISATQFSRLRESTTSFSGMASVWTIDRSNLIIDTRPGESAGSDGGQARIGLVSAHYFSTLGLHLAIGRAFTPGEDRYPGGAPVAVISHDYWLRRFARTPDIIGRTFRLNGTIYEIIGVAPRGFSGEWVGLPT